MCKENVTKTKCSVSSKYQSELFVLVLAFVLMPDDITPKKFKQSCNLSKKEHFKI